MFIYLYGMQKGKQPWALVWEWQLHMQTFGAVSFIYFSQTEKELTEMFNFVFCCLEGVVVF